MFACNPLCTPPFHPLAHPPMRGMPMQPRTLFPMGGTPPPNLLEENARLRATLAAHEAAYAALKDDNKTLHKLYTNARTTHKPEGKSRPGGDQRRGRHEITEKERVAMTRGKKPMLHKDAAEVHLAMGSACLHAMNTAKGSNERSGRRKVADNIMEFVATVYDGEVLESLLQKNAQNSKFDVVQMARDVDLRGISVTSINTMREWDPAVRQPYDRSVCWSASTVQRKLLPMAKFGNQALGGKLIDGGNTWTTTPTIALQNVFKDHYINKVDPGTFTIENPAIATATGDGLKCGDTAGLSACGLKKTDSRIVEQVQSKWQYLVLTCAFANEKETVEYFLPQLREMKRIENEGELADGTPFHLKPNICADMKFLQILSGKCNVN